MGVHPGQLTMTGVGRVSHSTVAFWVALLLGGCGGVPGAGDASPTPSPTASDEPSATASPLVRPLRNPDIDPGVPEVLEPGTYVLDRFPVDLAFDIPDGEPPGWHAGQASADTTNILWYTPPNITYGFALWNVDNVYADPCDAAAGELEPPIGPSVDDLVAALSNLPGLEATAPVDVTVGAFQGKEIELTTLSVEDCPSVTVFRAGNADRDYVNPLDAETFRVRILDVDGHRIVLYTFEPAERDAVADAELDQILDSMRIEQLS